MTVLSVSDAARELGIKPRLISDLFYDRGIEDGLCPVISGRRVIPREALPVIRRALETRGKLPASEAAAS